MVSSKGIKRLESAGIKVNVGQLKYEADQMIEYHAKFILEKIPFFKDKSSLKNSEFITLIFSVLSIFIISLIIAASPNLELLIILGI